MKIMIVSGIRVALALGLIATGAQNAAAADLDQKLQFDIPAHTALAEALIEWSSRTGAQVMTAANTITTQQTTREVKGTLPARAALVTLLKDSGLVYSTDGDTVTVTPEGNLRRTSRNTSDSTLDPSTDPSPTSTAIPSNADFESSPEDSQNKQLQVVVVTGSHIRGEEPASSIIVIDRSEIEQSGYQDVGQLVRSLPQSFGGGQNKGTVNATNGVTPSDPSTVNLRGLGSESTLTLVNGHRLAYDAAAPAVDISIIPLAAVDRVEILTDGASAIYGSDAVAGVANFILRKDFKGLYTSAALGRATEGGGFQQQYNTIGGDSWDGGNALISYEFAKQDRIDASQRSYVAPDLAGTSLWPATKRNSIFFAISQNVTSSVTGYAQALYTHRNTADPQNQAFFYPGLFADSTTSIDQYGLTAGLDVALGKDWRVSVSGDYSGDNDDNQANVNSTDGVIQFADDVKYHNRLSAVDLQVDGPLFTLPSGVIKLAAGAGIRGERFGVQNTPPSPGADTTGSRTVRDVYTEVAIPLVPSTSREGTHILLMDLAGRYENYSDFGHTFNSKAGLVYEPLAGLKFRATYGTAFRAPSLLQEHQITSTTLNGGIPDPASPDGTAIILALGGGNPALGPEKSTTTTAGLDYVPAWDPGLSLGLSWFDIRYRDRIAQPVTNSFAVFLDPFLSPFVVRNPSEALQAATLARSAFFNNLTGLPYDPTTVAGFVDSRYQNFSHQRANGVDLLARYHLLTSLGSFDFSFNSAYLSLRQQFLQGSPEQTLSGTVFNPPDVRMRAGLAWNFHRWSAAVFGNYTGSSKDPVASPPASIASWTTFDGVIGYSLSSAEHNKPLVHIELAAQNLFNRTPPYAEPIDSGLPGLHYDSTNANPIGRFLSLQLGVQW